VQLKRIGALSLVKVFLVLYGGIGLIVGVIFALAAIAGATAGMAEEAGPLAGVLFGAGAIVFLPILYAVMGAVAALLIAGLYNLAAGLTGGVELELR
jgi:hypothetical protein